MEHESAHSSSGRHRKPETGDVSSATPEPIEGSDIAYPNGEEPWIMPEAWSEENDTDDTLNETVEENETDESQHGEGKNRLRLSSHLRQHILESLDYIQHKGTETAGEWTENKKFNVKNYYFQHQIDSTTKKLERYKNKSQTAVAGIGISTYGVGRFRRQKFASKARMMQRRLQGLHGFQHQTQAGFNSRPTNPDTTEGISTLRKAREEYLLETLGIGKDYYKEVVQEQPMIQNKKGEWVRASFFDMVRKGRRNKRIMKAAAQHPDTPRADVQTLNRLIQSTQSLENLEELGRNGFAKEIWHLPLIRDAVRKSAARVVHQFEATLNEEKDQK